MEFKVSENKIWLEDEAGKEIAVIDFPEVEEGIVNIVHTEVDASLQGQGIASKLTEACVNQLREDHRKARLSCSYAIRWFSNHTEAHDVLEDPEKAQQQAQELMGEACGIQPK